VKKTGYFLSSDGVSNLYYSEWVPDGEVKFTLQIIHGMSEYIDRYDELARYLNGFGILVYGNDHIGHGHSAKRDDYGYFGARDGWKHLIDDEELMHHIVLEEYQRATHVLLGHSMGSFICRGYIARYGGKNFSGAIIEGTAGQSPAYGAGIVLGNIIKLFKGAKAKSLLLTIAAFGSYSKRIPDKKTNNDWISTDEKVVMEYKADPMCGFHFKIGGYLDLFRLLKYVNSGKCYDRMPVDLPLLLISGSEDPVGAYGAGPAEVCDRLKMHGCKSCELIIYKGMRHELHNEIGKEAVYEDIKDFVVSRK